MSEDDCYVEVCIVSFNLTGMIEVEITSPDVKEVDNPAFGMYDIGIEWNLQMKTHGDTIYMCGRPV